MTIRVVLADDHTLVREGIRSLLALLPDIKVVGEAATGTDAARLIRETKPDVALLDVRFPDVSGLDVLRQLDAERCAPRTIFLTTFDDDQVRRKAIALRAAGFLLKDVSLDALAHALRTVANGGQAFGVSSALKGKVPADDAAPAIEQPSKRELEILRLASAGLGNREIAKALCIAEGTVKNHISNVLIKLDARDRTQAVLRAIKLGLL